MRKLNFMMEATVKVFREFFQRIIRFTLVIVVLTSEAVLKRCFWRLHSNSVASSKNFEMAAGSDCQLDSVLQGDSSRVLRHFHFTTWPDFGVPEPPQKLVKFVRAFRDRVGYDQKPIITHCRYVNLFFVPSSKPPSHHHGNNLHRPLLRSAGVGRSGTLIVLDSLLQHILKYDCVDIYGMVYEMRKDRVWMVQTEVRDPPFEIRQYVLLL